MKALLGREGTRLAAGAREGRVSVRGRGAAEEGLVIVGGEGWDLPDADVMRAAGEEHRREPGSAGPTQVARKHVSLTMHGHSLRNRHRRVHRSTTTLRILGVSESGHRRGGVS